MRSIFLLFTLVIIWAEIAAQETTENISGNVSFVSSQNIYVKFKNTEGISIGDTLYLLNENSLIPALLVTGLSSTSCLCNAILGETIPVDHLIIARKKINRKETVQKSDKTEATVQVKQDSTAKDQPGKAKNQQRIIGSFSINSYTDISNSAADNSQRMRYTLQFDAQNINDSKLSLESYISFKHKQGEWSEVKNNLFDALKIYNLAVRYDMNNTTSLSFGRRINQKIANIGASDGFQFEKVVNNLTFGAILGSRPDFTDFGYNPKLLQFGAYSSFKTRGEKSFSESSIAVMQQMNSSSVDRRFLYFQHSNSFLKNLFLFSTFEVDLYKLDNTGNPTTVFNPIGFYLSLNYRINRKFNLSGSYDARKNVVYYETYKNYLDRILENETRQGFRLMGNYRITKDIIFGLQTGYRFLKSDPHPSKNIYSYISYYNIPFVKFSMTVSATLLESNYMNGHIFSGNISKDFFQGKIQTAMGYRFIDYRLPESYLNYTQHIGEFNLSWSVYKSIYISLNYEGNYQGPDNYHRIYLQLRLRF